MIHQKKNCLVSVIIPSYNCEGCINRAVLSVLNQTYKNIEIIIIRNGGHPLPKLPDDPRIRVIDLKENNGVSKARNLGVREAKGEYIALLDADDYWVPEKLKIQMNIILRYERDGVRPDICFTGRRLFYEKDNHIRKGGIIGCDKIVTYRRLLRSNQINCSSVVIARSLLLENAFPDGTDMHEDYAVWLSILREGGYAVGINRPLLYYRVSIGSKSGNKLRSAVMTYKVYRFIGLGLFESLLHMITYTYYGIKKYSNR